MTDTSADVAAYVAAAYARRTPAERLRQATELFAAARILALAGIRAQYGMLTPALEYHALLVRLHGTALDERTRQAIVARRYGAEALSER